MDPLGSLIAWAAHYGAAGLLTVALLERLVPVVPSYGLLVAVGIGAAEGLWPVPTALLAMTAGSLAGCGACYAFAAAVGEARSVAFLLRFARVFGVSPLRMERLIAYFRDHQLALTFGAQLVPTVRLIAPGIAGLLRADARTFAAASAMGLVVWNSLFLGVGYAASVLAVSANASTLALKILLLLVVGEGLALLVWRRQRRRDETAQKVGDPALMGEGNGHDF